MTKRLAVGAVAGIAWGVIATGVFSAMFRGLIPAPGELALPFAIGLVLLYGPFLVALGLEALLGRASPAFAEIVAVALASGMILGVAAARLVGLAQRVATPSRGRARPRP